MELEENRFFIGFYLAVGVFSFVIGILVMDGIIEIGEITIIEAYGFTLALFGALCFVIANFYYKFRRMLINCEKMNNRNQADINTLRHRLESHVELLVNRVESLERKIDKKDP